MSCTENVIKNNPRMKLNQIWINILSFHRPFCASDVVLLETGSDSVQLPKQKNRKAQFTTQRGV